MFGQEGSNPQALLWGQAGVFVHHYAVDGRSLIGAQPFVGVAASGVEGSGRLHLVVYEASGYRGGCGYGGCPV